MRFQARDHVLDDHGLSHRRKPGRFAVSRWRWSHLGRDLIQEAVEGLHHSGPKAGTIGCSQIERVDLRVQNGYDVLNPAVRVQHAVANVTELSQIHPERAPDGKNMNRLPDGIARGRKQQQSRSEAKPVNQETTSVISRMHRAPIRRGA